MNPWATAEKYVLQSEDGHHVDAALDALDRPGRVRVRRRYCDEALVEFHPDPEAVSISYCTRDGRPLSPATLRAMIEVARALQTKRTRG